MEIGISLRMMQVILSQEDCFGFCVFAGLMKNSIELVQHHFQTTLN